MAQKEPRKYLHHYLIVEGGAVEGGGGQGEFVCWGGGKEGRERGDHFTLTCRFLVFSCSISHLLLLLLLNLYPGR